MRTQLSPDGRISYAADAKAPLETPDPPIKGCVIRALSNGTPVWTLDDDGRGLAIQITPELPRRGKAWRWHLGILHVPSGYRAFGRRANVSGPIEWSAANLRTMRRVLALFRAAPVDWTAARPDLGSAGRELLARAIEAFPARPAWRAWRFDRRGYPEHKWLASADKARTWARATASAWAVETWTIPPGDLTVSPFRVEPPRYRTTSLEALSWSGLVVSEVEWSDGVRLSRRTAAGVEDEQIAPAEVEDVLEYAWAQRPKPGVFGDPDPIVEELVARGWLRLEERAGATWCVPTVRGVLTLARAARCDPAPERERTDEAWEAWRASRSESQRWRWGHGGDGALRHRLTMFLRLLRCLARDAAAAEPRLELPGLWGNAQRAGSAEVQDVRDGAGVVHALVSYGWEWAHYRTAPIVPWAPRSALGVPLGPPDREGYRERQIWTSGAGDWARRAADELRRGTPCA